jgi:Tfp pilus assembly protein PilN
MIKINLLRNLGFDQVGAGGMIPGLSSESAGAARTAIIKLVVFLVVPVALLAYERSNLSALNDELAAVQAKIQGKDRQIGLFGDTAPKVEQYAISKKKLDRELEVIKGLARNRLREVKTLDAIQGLMPNPTWLKSITFHADTVVLEGYTNGEDGVGELSSALSSAGPFSKVSLKSTTEEELPTGTVKKFTIELQVGK